MQLHGSTEGNLISAIRSANRLRDRPVHSDTVKFWSELIQHARKEFTPLCENAVGGPDDRQGRVGAGVFVGADVI